MKTLSGAVVGAVSLELIRDVLTRFEYWRMSLGLLIILVVIIAPEGIVGGARRLGQRLGLTRETETSS